MAVLVIGQRRVRVVEDETKNGHHDHTMKEFECNNYFFCYCNRVLEYILWGSDRHQAKVYKKIILAAMWRTGQKIDKC